MFLWGVCCNIEEGKAATLNGFVSSYKNPQLRMVKGKLWSWMKLKETQTLAVIHKKDLREGRRKILYTKHLTFKLYLSVCSGGSTEPGKPAAQQQGLGLIIGKADLPLGEVGTGLHLCKFSLLCLHSIQGSSWGFSTHTRWGVWLHSCQCLCTLGQAGEWKGTCVSSPEILVK